MWSIVSDDVPAWAVDRPDTLRRAADARRLARLVRYGGKRREL